MILVRHGRTTANTSGVLAGRTAGVRLDDTGVTQAERTAERLAAVPLVAIVTSPLERCRQTARAIATAQQGTPATATERGITECDYGAWQGRSLGAISVQLRDAQRNGGRDLPALLRHVSEDTLVGWAWAPGAGRAPAPGTQAEFGAVMRAWAESGAHCPPE